MVCFHNASDNDKLQLLSVLHVDWFVGFAAIRVQLIVILVRVPFLLPLLLEAAVYCGEDCTVVQRLPVLKPMFVVPLHSRMQMRRRSNRADVRSQQFVWT